MSSSSKVNASFGAVSTSHLDLLTSAVTQLTAISSGVSLLTQAGVITTVTATVATQANISFTVSHPDVNTNTVVLANMSHYTGNGLPIVRVTNTTSGSFTLTINNLASVGALNAPIKISTFISN
jgi:hypothetical protein